MIAIKQYFKLLRPHVVEPVSPQIQFCAIPRTCSSLERESTLCSGYNQHILSYIQLNKFKTVSVLGKNYMNMFSLFTMTIFSVKYFEKNVKICLENSNIYFNFPVIKSQKKNFRLRTCKRFFFLLPKEKSVLHPTLQMLLTSRFSTRDTTIITRLRFAPNQITVAIKGNKTEKLTKQILCLFKYS